MMQFYSKKSPSEEQIRPEIIQYLINYSKQLRIIQTNKNHYIELHLN